MSGPGVRILITLMRIRILLVTWMRILLAKPWKSVQIGSFWLFIRKFMRIRIQLIILMWIRIRSTALVGTVRIMQLLIWKSRSLLFSYYGTKMSWSIALPLYYFKFVFCSKIGSGFDLIWKSGMMWYVTVIYVTDTAVTLSPTSNGWKTSTRTWIYPKVLIPIIRTVHVGRLS